MLSFIGAILVARMLHPDDYGLMALAGIWTMTIEMIAELGLGAAIIQFRDVEETELNACFWLTMSLSIGAYVGLYSVAPAIAGWFGSPRLVDVLRVVGVTLPLIAVRMVPDSLLRKQLAMDKISQAEILASLVTIPVMVWMAWMGAGVWALVGGVVLLPFVQGVVTFRFVGWFPGFRIGGARLGQILHYSLAALGSRLCWSVYQQADVFVLGKVSGDVLLGFYSMAKQLATLPVTKLSGMVNQIASPVMAELQANPTALRASLLRGIRLLACVTFPLCIGVISVAEDLVRVMLTDKWLPVVPILQILSLYALIKSLDTLFPPVLMARYRTNFLFWYTAVLLGIMPLAFWAGAVWGGVLGVASAWVLIYPIVMLWMAREVLLEIDVSWKLLCQQVWSPLAATFVMGAALLIVHWSVSSWPNEQALARLVVVSLTGIVVYCASLVAFSRPLWREMQEVAGWIIGYPRLRPTK